MPDLATMVDVVMMGEVISLSGIQVWSWIVTINENFVFIFLDLAIQVGQLG